MAKSEYGSAIAQFRLLSLELARIAIEQNWDRSKELLEELLLLQEHIARLEKMGENQSCP